MLGELGFGHVGGIIGRVLGVLEQVVVERFEHVERAEPRAMLPGVRVEHQLPVFWHVQVLEM